MIRTFAAVTVLSIAGTAFGALLLPGQSFKPAPGEVNPVGGTIIGTQTSPFVSGTFSGTLVTQVIQGDTSNALGGLTFVYILTNDNYPANDSIGRLTVTGYTGWTTDASFDSASAGVAPLAINRQANGSSIGFNFLNQDTGLSVLGPGQTTTRLVVQTDAPAFTQAIANVINGSVTTMTTLAPTIPTPGAAALGLAGGLLVARRRRAN